MADARNLKPGLGRSTGGLLGGMMGGGAGGTGPSINIPALLGQGQDGGIFNPLTGGLFSGDGAGLGKMDFLGTALDKRLFPNKEKATYGTAMPTPELAANQGIMYQHPESGEWVQYKDFTLNAPRTAGSQLDETGIEAIKTRATGVGESPWLKMAKERQGLEESAMLDKASKGAAAQGAEARAALAMRGGLRGGAAERLAGGSARDTLLAQQGVRQQGALERSGLGVEDERQKLDLLKQLPSAQLAAAGYKSGLDQFNIGNEQNTQLFNVQSKIKDLADRNDYSKFKYGEEMKAKGAAMSAQATENAGKK